jgi:nucleotide-binding universal stress UspA family protein
VATTPERKRILVAVDGSEQSRQAVLYSGNILPTEGIEIVLYHVLTKIPDPFWDLSKEHALRHKIVGIKSWEAHQENAIKTFMSDAKKDLVALGFPPEAVTVKIRERKVGIARDIIAESMKDFGAVVVGRKGTSELKDLMIGSVANKLVERLTHIPVWIVGGSPQPEKLLVAMDSSDGAMWAVDHVANMLHDPEMKVTLFHAVRKLALSSGTPETSFVQTEDKEWIALTDEKVGEALEAISPVFEDARTRLIQAGLAPDCIECRVVDGVRSRAGAIVAEAEREGHGTIVLGRRGLSRVQDFFMGRVSSKVLQLAGNKAVWVVS